MIAKFISSITSFWFPQVSARILAVMRILLGTALLYDVLSSISERQEMFGAEGVLGPLGSRRPFENLVSLLEAYGHSLPGFATAGVNLIFAIYVCALLFFLVGYAYRISAMILTLIFFYLQFRNYLVFDSGHSLAAVLIFFFIFLPADATCSLSQYLRVRNWRQTFKEKIFLSAWPVRVIQVQMCILYFSTFLFKLSGQNWREGTAVYYATRLPVYTRPEIQFFFDLPSITMIANYGTLVVEGLFAVLVWNRRLRPWVLAGTICFHLILEQVFYINIFQWVMITGILSFLAVKSKTDFKEGPPGIPTFVQK